MNVEELIEALQRAVRTGKLHGLGAVMIRNTAVSEAAMEAGSDGYSELSELLFPGDDTVRLLIEEW